MEQTTSAFHLPTLHCTFIGFASDWRVSDSSPLTEQREVAFELDIGAFLHCKELDSVLRAFGSCCCESWESPKNRWKFSSLKKRDFRKRSRNHRDLILASKENRDELQDDEVKKTASNRHLCSLAGQLFAAETQTSSHKYVENHLPSVVQARYYE